MRKDDNSTLLLEITKSTHKAQNQEPGFIKSISGPWSLVLHKCLPSGTCEQIAQLEFDAKISDNSGESCFRFFFPLPLSWIEVESVMVT